MGDAESALDQEDGGRDGRHHGPVSKGLNHRPHTGAGVVVVLGHRGLGPFR